MFKKWGKWTINSGCCFLLDEFVCAKRNEVTDFVPKTMHNYEQNVSGTGNGTFIFIRVLVTKSSKHTSTCDIYCTLNGKAITGNYT